MKKYFVCSDIHGFYDEWVAALENKGFDVTNPNHILIVCGDLMDRGTKPLECLKFVNSLPADRKILVRGNHEDLLEEILRTHTIHYYDITNGTFDTCKRLANCSDEVTNDSMIFHVANNDELTKYYDSLVDYAEVGDYIFVHGWIGNCQLPLDEQDWKNSRWINGMRDWKIGNVVKGKTIVCGHWHTGYGNHWYHHKGESEYSDLSIFEDEGIIAVDGCVAYSKNVNVYVFEA